MPSKNSLLLAIEFVIVIIFITVVWIAAGKTAQAYMADADFAYIFLAGGLVSILLMALLIAYGFLLFPMKINK